ncbi:MAG: hypothetical protein ACYCV7_04195 [Acidimicrobiales bacterium]
MAVPGRKEMMMLEVEPTPGDSAVTVPEALPAAVPDLGRRPRASRARGHGTGGGVRGRTRYLRRDEDGRGGGRGPVRGEDGVGYDLRNAWQVLAGSILIPLGLVFILLAWYGAAHARVVQQQIPYMVSGSFIGLGCMVVGGLLYWGHWLYRLYDQQELHHGEEIRILRELADSLSASVTGGAVHVPVRSSDSGNGTTKAKGSFVVTAMGSVYHQGDCPVIAHHPDDARVVGMMDLGGRRPCQICRPGS